MNIFKSGPGNQGMKTSSSVVVTTNSTENSTLLTGDTVMAPSIQVFVQVTILFCVVSASLSGITDFEKRISQLEIQVKESQEQIKSLHWVIEHLEKRLRQLEAKGECDEVLI